MIKYCLTFIAVLSLIQINVKAQTNNFYVKYKIFNGYKGIDGTISYTEMSGDLSVGTDSASYINYFSEDQEKKANRKIEGFEYIDTTKRKLHTYINKIKNSENKVMYCRDFIPIATKKNQSLWYQDTLNAIKWSLGTKSKYIDSLLCYDAYASFRGRNYAVWFCPDIPISYGPWKLDGCPGLIVEFSDSNSSFMGKLEFFQPLLKNINPYLPKEYISFENFEKTIKDDFSLKLRKWNQVQNASCLDCASKSVITLATFDFSISSNNLK